ncbi:MAG: hypothetical protein AABY22_13445 [Nanoarchaeota archaeon]
MKDKLEHVDGYITKKGVKVNEYVRMIREDEPKSFDPLTAFRKRIK